MIVSNWIKLMISSIILFEQLLIYDLILLSLQQYKEVFKENIK